MSRKSLALFHISLACLQLIYIYTPVHNWHYGLTVVQYVTFPLLLLTGACMMLGNRARLKKKMSEVPALFRLS